jgi:hypothetical protein
MSPDGSYNGYANYQTWNVCLWISNDEGLNEVARGCTTYSEFIDKLRNEFTVIETPDRVAYNDSGINMAEMVEYWEENFSKVPA